MKILIKSATILDQNSPHHLDKKDILVENAKIIELGDEIKATADKVYNIKDLHVSPSWFDAGVSFGEPGFEERETIANGLLVAQKSGFGDIALSADNIPKTDSRNLLESLRNKAANTWTKIHPTACLTKGMKGKDLAELYDLHQAGANVFYDDLLPIENPNLLKLALQYTQAFGGCVASFPLEKKVANQAQVHESPTSTKLGLKGMPSLAESLQIARDLAILEYSGGNLHIPMVSTAEGVERIKKAKNSGLKVTCSVAIHHLLLDDEALLDFDANAKVFPPLREQKDTLALRNAIKEGVIDFVTTDHRPVNLERKEVDFVEAAYGSIGLESAFGALNKLLGAELAVQMLTNGKKLYGVKQHVIQQGEMAKLTLFNPHDTYRFTEEHILSKSKNAIFLHRELKGKVVGVI